DVALAGLPHEVRRGLRRAGVVPQECGPDDAAVRVERDEPVLLATHGDGVDVGQAAGLRERLLEGDPPRLGVDLGAVRVASLPAADETARLCVADDDLAGLRRAVDPGDEPAGER